MDVVERTGGRRAVAATDGLEIDTVKRLVHDIKRLKSTPKKRYTHASISPSAASSLQIGDHVLCCGELWENVAPYLLLPPLPRSMT